MRRAVPASICAILAWHFGCGPNGGQHATGHLQAHSGWHADNLAVPTRPSGYAFEQGLVATLGDAEGGALDEQRIETRLGSGSLDLLEKGPTTQEPVPRTSRPPARPRAG